MTSAAFFFGKPGCGVTAAQALNDDFFASIISDPQLGHSVVFHAPSQQWFCLDPVDQLYHSTSEAKLVTLLSALLA